jgi:hypothetical protein
MFMKMVSSKRIMVAVGGMSVVREDLLVVR